MFGFVSGNSVTSMVKQLITLIFLVPTLVHAQPISEISPSDMIGHYAFNGFNNDGCKQLNATDVEQFHHCVSIHRKDVVGCTAEPNSVLTEINIYPSEQTCQEWFAEFTQFIHKKSISP